MRRWAAAWSARSEPKRCSAPRSSGSQSFANPAVTIARVFTDTFAGIAPSGAVAFVPIQIVSAAGAVLLMRWLYPSLTSIEGHIVVPELEEREGAS